MTGNQAHLKKVAPAVSYRLAFGHQNIFDFKYVEMPRFGLSKLRILVKCFIK